MPKVKTHKGTAKRFQKRPSGKITHRSAGQDHFNSRATGKKTKNKRLDSKLASVNERLKKLIPYK